jgi:hypothetical protein
MNKAFMTNDSILAIRSIRTLSQKARIFIPASRWETVDFKLAVHQRHTIHRFDWAARGAWLRRNVITNS